MATKRKDKSRVVLKTGEVQRKDGSTIDNIHTVLHQVLQIAVDDDFIRNNPSDNVLRELKKDYIST